MTAPFRFSSCASAAGSTATSGSWNVQLSLTDSVDGLTVGYATVTSSQVTVDRPLSERSRTVRVTPVGAAARTRAGIVIGALTVNGT